MERESKVIDRVAGLDSLRFVCALWVFFSHGAAPELFPVFPSGSVAVTITRGIQGNIWVGIAAVVVFFIISGFCIHYPFAGTRRRPNLSEFYTRRFLRLTVPLAFAFPVTAFLSSESPFSNSFPLYAITWSVIAEMVYYFVYPFIRFLHLRIGSWYPVIIGSYILSFAVILSAPTTSDYHGFGSGLTWVVGLPCWLLGCAVAESVKQRAFHGPSTGTIWCFRAAILATASICSILRFHSPIGFPWTLNIFALLAAFWLLREIEYHATLQSGSFFERAGAWSYSFYLLHPGAIVFLQSESIGGKLDWTFKPLLWGGVLLICYAFYIVVELPSHHLARRTSSLFKSTTQRMAENREIYPEKSPESLSI